MATSATEQVESALDAAHQALDTLAKDLRETIAALEAKVETLTTERDEWKAQAETVDEDLAETIADQSDALDHVRYWLLDVLAHDKRPTDPRRVLRTVERALGI